MQGRVSHEGTPVAEATVMEMDANHRILNHTRTDGQGRFVMKVTGGKTSLRVTARGMRRFTQKIGRNTRWEVEMKEDNTPQVPNKVRSRHETMKLFVGHMQNRAIAQISWVEHLTDTTLHAGGARAHAYHGGGVSHGTQDDGDGLQRAHHCHRHVHRAGRARGGTAQELGPASYVRPPTMRRTMPRPSPQTSATTLHTPASPLQRLNWNI